MAKSSTPHRMSAEEIGFLAGGPGRAAEAALARLMDGGHVRVSREGLVTAVHQNGYGAMTASTGQETGALRQTLVDSKKSYSDGGRCSSSYSS